MSDKKETLEPYTLEQCNSCKEQSKRKFSKGDYVFKEVPKCSSCEGQIKIIKIFGETFSL